MDPLISVYFQKKKYWKYRWAEVFIGEMLELYWVVDTARRLLIHRRWSFFAALYTLCVVWGAVWFTSAIFKIFASSDFPSYNMIWYDCLKSLIICSLSLSLSLSLSMPLFPKLLDFYTKICFLDRSSLINTNIIYKI